MSHQRTRVSLSYQCSSVSDGNDMSHFKHSWPVAAVFPKGGIELHMRPTASLVSEGPFWLLDQQAHASLTVHVCKGSFQDKQMLHKASAKAFALAVRNVVASSQIVPTQNAAA